LPSDGAARQAVTRQTQSFSGTLNGDVTGTQDATVVTMIRAKAFTDIGRGVTPLKVSERR
jgi:glutamine amidotransferase PdxT